MSQSPKPKSWFPYFLGGIFAVFIGLMVYVWHGASQANPIMLDEQGRQRPAGSGGRH